MFGSAVGERIKSVKTAWRATCRRVGIEDLQLRDLRREFGSRLRESGASDHDVRDFLGHANISTTSRYLGSTPLRLERALADLEAGGGYESISSDRDDAQMSLVSSDLTVSATQMGERRRRAARATGQRQDARAIQSRTPGS